MASSFLQAKTRSNSWTAFGVLLAYLVAVKLLITIWPDAFRSTTQAQVFAWPMLAIATACGAIGVTLLRHAGFAGGWDKGISIHWRFWIPVVSGAGLGVAAIVTDRVTHWTAFVANQMHIPSIHIAWPASIVIYPGGAIIVEIFYRLLLMPLLMWLICVVFLHGRGRHWIFWTIAIATSLVEPYGDLDLVKLGLGTVLAVFAQDFVLNLWQAYLFCRAGFVASILTRVAFYLIWHVIWLP